MKNIIILSFLLFIGASASPLNRWELEPDSLGNMHLVDLNPIEAEIEPAFVPADDIVYLLFTRRNPTSGQQIFLNEGSLRGSHFNPSHPTRMLIHGWTGNRNDAVNIEATRAYLQLDEFNIIVVDWGAGAQTPNYLTARNRVRPTGEHAASLLDFLHSIDFIRFPDTHCIGHSLGGHAVGIVGKSVSRGRVQVVYGLDPAGPLFNLDTPTERIHSTDGVYVEVMHTNGGTQGFREPLGDADFFPNGGRSQPGCGNDIGGPCAHARTVFLYAESINNRFSARQCTSFEEVDDNRCTPTGVTANMGGPFGNIGLTGLFHLTTNGESPFSQG